MCKVVRSFEPQGLEAIFGFNLSQVRAQRLDNQWVLLRAYVLVVKLVIRRQWILIFK